MSVKNPVSLLSDRPLTDPHFDRLEYAPLARHLAEAIYKMAPSDGFAIGIFGSWGSGKTTLLNFVLHYLNEMPEEERPVIVRFNPWWFSGREDLVERFFSQLLAVLPKYGLERLKKSIIEFAESLAELPRYGWLARLLPAFFRPGDVPERKGKIAKALEKENRKILVIVDDIDRLTADEIREFFRVVKAIADFPKVVYLLAFDKKVVVQALEEEQGIPGERYLEKIIQFSFELPLPDKVSLRRLLFESIGVVLSGTPDELFDQIYWSNVYFEGIDHFIRTPRDVVRLTNALKVTYPAVKGEVHAVDFIAIEAIRVFCPLAYDVIRKNPDMFAGVVASGLLAPLSREKLRVFHEGWLDSIPEEDREPIKRLLKRLFPKLEEAWGNISYNPDWLPKWRKARYVRSPDVFPIYFRLANPEGDIANAEMKAFLSYISDPKKFGGLLVDLAKQLRPDRTTRVRVFLERFQDYAEDIPLESIPPIIQALVDVGDQLLRPEDEPISPFDIGDNRFQIGRVVWLLLRRLAEPKRYEILKSAIESGRSVAIVAWLVAILGQQHGQFGAERQELEEERLVSAEHLRELEELAVKKIRKAAEEGSLLKAPHLPQILFLWRECGDESEVREWVNQVVESDEGLAEFIERFLSKSYVQSLSDVVGREEYRLNPKYIEPYLDPTIAYQRIKNLEDQPWLTEKQKIAIRQFLREYELLQAGLDPDSPASMLPG